MYVCMYVCMVTNSVRQTINCLTEYKIFDKQNISSQGWTLTGLKWTGEYLKKTTRTWNGEVWGNCFGWEAIGVEIS